MCSLFILGSITAEGKIVTDLTGKKVEISDNIQKVAIVPIPWASLAYAVDGSASKIVGMHPSAIGAYKISILKEMAPEMEKINSTFVDNNFNMNYEELALLKPELVVIWDYQGEVKEKLDKIKIPSVAPAETTQTNQPQAAADVLPETAYGTYKGVMPCADCSGIRTEFILDPKGLYTMNQVYEGTRDGSSQTFSEGGTYTTKGDVVTLATGNQVKVEKDQIRFLDADGKVIDGEIGQYYILKKDAK